VIDDDRRDRRVLEAALPGIAAKFDILLGPYSTVHMRTAGRIGAESDLLVWKTCSTRECLRKTRNW
jgi:hypothetical protein